MKLISVALHGYKRFEQPSSMNVDGKLIAVVGPNESGKSSFLEALEHLNDHEPLVVSGGTRETTRNVNIPANQNVIKATYLLDDDDREALKDVQGGSEIRWCTVSKRVSGTHIYVFTPRPMRSLQPRRRAVQTLKDVSSRRGFLKIAEEYEAADLVAVVESLASSLDTEEQTFSDEVLEEIRSVVARLEDAVADDGLKYLRDLVQQLSDLAEHETGNLVRQSIDILSERRPVFLPFSEKERLLSSTYNLDEVWQNPPAALRNLAQLAGLDLRSLHDAVSANDDGGVATIEERVNNKLRREFEAWSQSDISVTFRTTEQILKVLVREEISGEQDARLTSITERSDGLRQFVALIAFAASKPSEQEHILLIDEAETHLHYDAQADLVEILASQDIVTKVIYTTHSMGCLPEDLGTGVRFIASNEPESFTSRMGNAFWTSEKPGFSPLLFGMGASTLAFIPIRDAVITEGPSDMILWPTLLREATGRTHLDLQIVPGLSRANRDEIVVLDREAPRTAYLLDSDAAGRNLRRKLRDAGVAAKRIFQIPGRQRGLVVEDLIEAEVYVRAVNEELRRSHGPDYSFPDDRLPAVGRPKEVETWCNENGIKNPPKKTAVAYRVLEEGIGQSVLAERYHKPITLLFRDITTELQG